MNIRKARQDDLSVILQILDDARAKMAASGNPNQWKPGYPSVRTLENDLASGVGYMVEDDGPVAYFAMIPSPDPTYAVIQGAWIDDSPYYVLHRVATKAGVHGVFPCVLAFARATSPHLRIDTHADNVVVQHLAHKYGFVYCGIIHVADGTPRLAYELPG